MIVRRLQPISVAASVRRIFLKQNVFHQRIQHLTQKPTFLKRTEGYTQLKKKEFQVNPGFGTLRTTGNVDCVIRPANPHEYPDADRAFVYVYGDSTSCSQDIDVQLTGESKDVLTVNAFPDSPHLYCEIELPIKYDLDIKLFNDAALQILGMEADEVNINTVDGDINTKGLKCHNIHINTVRGNIAADGTLQGNIFIKAKKTSITARRLQGMALSIDAEELDTLIESSYMTQGEITTHRGNINLKNLHGCTDLVLRSGNLTISGLHGQIAGFVGTGNVDVQVTDVTSNSTLHVNQGDMNISILEDPRHDIEVTAPSLEISSQLQPRGVMSSDKNQTFTLTEKDAERSLLMATVLKGMARLKCKDWFSTLGIKSS